MMASVSLDRYFRLHSTKPLPEEVGGVVGSKGRVIGRVYMQSTPTAVVWADSYITAEDALPQVEADDVWETMVNVDDGPPKKRQRLASVRTKHADHYYFGTNTDCLSFRAAKRR